MTSQAAVETKSVAAAVAGSASASVVAPEVPASKHTAKNRGSRHLQPKKHVCGSEATAAAATGAATATCAKSGGGSNHIPFDGNWKYLSDKFRKTRLCWHNFVYGFCKWGAGCLFVHEPRVSLYQNNGTLCDFGDRCAFFQRFPLCMKIHPRQKAAHKRETSESATGCVAPLAPGGPMMGLASTTTSTVAQVCELKGDMQVLRTPQGFDVQYLGERGADTSFVFIRWPVELERACKDKGAGAGVEPVSLQSVWESIMTKFVLESSGADTEEASAKAESEQQLEGQ